MYIKILLNLILGYIRVEVEGYYIERFINICTSKKIPIWNLKREKGVKLYLNIGINDFKRLSEVSRKTKCKVKIKNKRGIPFILKKYKKRKLFIILLIILISIIYASSKYVWNIEYEVEENKKIENIEKDIEELGIKIGIKKSKIDTDKIINEIRLKRDDISWMGIEIKGTNLKVKLVKSDEKPNLVNGTDYCNIVATKNGIIEKIIAQNGTAVVKQGDVVKEGDILIAGYMEGKYTDTRYVHSLGEIKAKVWYSDEEKVYYKQESLLETGEVEKKYQIKIKNFQINLYKTLSKFKIYDTIYTENNIKIFSDFYLPISVVQIENRKQIKEKKNYTIEEAKEIATKKVKERMENNIKNKDDIVDSNINIKEEKEYIQVEMTYEVLEDIGTTEKINN